MRDLVILILNYVACLEMAEVEIDLEIYYAVWNANTQSQENEIIAIMKNVIMYDGSWSQQALQY